MAGRIAHAGAKSDLDKDRDRVGRRKPRRTFQDVISSVTVQPLYGGLREGSRQSIIGEACYAFDGEAKCGEFAISVADHWQNQGFGSALLCAVQSRAISLGHSKLFGESLKSNDQMKGLARKAGFAFSCALDWRAVRFDKRLPGRPPASPAGSALPNHVVSPERTASLFTP